MTKNVIDLVLDDDEYNKFDDLAEGLEDTLKRYK